MTMEYGELVNKDAGGDPELNEWVAKYLFGQVPCDQWGTSTPVFVKQCDHPTGACYPEGHAAPYSAQAHYAFSAFERARILFHTLHPNRNISLLLECKADKWRACATLGRCGGSSAQCETVAKAICQALHHIWNAVVTDGWQASKQEPKT